METTEATIPSVAERMRIPWGPALSAGFLAAIVVMVTASLWKSSSGAASIVIEAARDSVSILWALPFALLLAAIATMPFIHKHWWEKYYPAVSLALATVAAAGYCIVFGRPEKWLHGMGEYVSFIILLGALFVVSGGISIHVGRRATPAANVTMLLTGAMLANVFGTTGAAMLLIRPFLRMNKGHLKPYHVVFFIFIVANVGGVLTPIGDPPLFLGYLSGVPFWWTFSRLQGAWVLAVGILLTVFFIFDTLDHRKQDREHPGSEGGRAVRILGVHNFALIGLIILAVFRPGIVEAVYALLHGARGIGAGLDLVLSREIMMVAAAIISWKLTPRHVHKSNEFTFGPIKEVAILFFGIFATMVPAIEYLQANARHLPLNTAGNYYFASGALSSVLDNAPTYKTFLEVKLAGIDGEHLHHARATLAEMSKRRSLEMHAALAEGPVRGAIGAMVEHYPEHVLAGTMGEDRMRLGFLLGSPGLSLFIVAISVGSVFWGACTYIGNGPNLMVKSIADAAGCKTPSFGGYIVRYALPILIPTYLLVWLIFFAFA
ncbi:MAG TPA: sodium:proton antiporter [Tepidisphaeraceae bacterium]|jgi:Na+/H+ antiporter NhaD/arsenite permease-like protein|nr:sodium:proton antiporter [Tepidisphaeraceae bacterium]